MKIEKIKKYLRLKPFSEDSEMGREAERYRRALLTIIANFTHKAITLFVMFATVNITLTFLGDERFGAFMTIMGLAMMLSFLDMGVGNAITNRVAEVAAKKNSELLSEVIKGGLGTLVIISLLAFFVLWVSVGWLPWEKIIKVSDNSIHDELVETIDVFLIMFALSMAFAGVSKVYVGLQRGYQSHIYNAIGSMLSLFLVYKIVDMNGSMPLLLAGSMAGLVAANGFLFVKLIRESMFSLNGLTKSMRNEFPMIIKVGGLFFLLQIGGMVAKGVDSLVISSVIGAAAVTMYILVQRLTQLVLQPLSIVNAPLWPSYANATAHNDKDYIRKTLIKSLLLTLGISLLGALGLVFVGDYIVSIWVGDHVDISTTLLISFAIWIVLESVGNAFAMFLNGVFIVKEQVVVVIAFVVLALPLKFWFAKSGNVEDVVIAGSIAYILTTVMGYGIIFRNKISARL